MRERSTLNQQASRNRKKCVLSVLSLEGPYQRLPILLLVSTAQAFKCLLRGMGEVP